MSDMHRHRKNGFTIVEMMIAATILAITLTGILVCYMACLELAELSKNSSIALHEVKSRLEKIRNTAFNQIKATYHSVSFVAAGFNGRGVSYVDDTDPELLKVTVSFSWKQPNGRVIGEDKDLDGQLDVGEDLNGNGQLDSLVGVVSQIRKR